MGLTLHYHPLSSYCWKVLIALYENNTDFDLVVVDLGDEASRTAFLKLWPIGKFPVLEDKRWGRVVAESTIIIDYLDRHYRGAVRFLPDEADAAIEVRAADRFYDLYIHERTQKIVGDRIRPADKRDPYGVDLARQQLATAYALLDNEIAKKQWAAGENFSMADCAAFPALFYAGKVEPFRVQYKNLAAYFDRLSARASVGRVLEEAQPFMHLFPRE